MRFRAFRIVLSVILVNFVLIDSHLLFEIKLMHQKYLLRHSKERSVHIWQCILHNGERGEKNIHKISNTLYFISAGNNYNAQLKSFLHCTSTASTLVVVYHWLTLKRKEVSKVHFFHLIYFVSNLPFLTFDPRFKLFG